jgi:hypothetical protein
MRNLTRKGLPLYMPSLLISKRDARFWFLKGLETFLLYSKEIRKSTIKAAEIAGKTAKKFTLKCENDFHLVEKFYTVTGKDPGSPRKAFRVIWLWDQSRCYT